MEAERAVGRLQNSRGERGWWLGPRRRPWRWRQVHGCRIHLGGKVSTLKEGNPVASKTRAGTSPNEGCCVQVTPES